jgi:hypothetical protein
VAELSCGTAQVDGSEVTVDKWSTKTLEVSLKGLMARSFPFDLVFFLSVVFSLSDVLEKTSTSGEDVRKPER